MLKVIIFSRYNSFIMREVFDIRRRLLPEAIRVYLNDYKSSLKRGYEYYKRLYATYLK